MMDVHTSKNDYRLLQDSLGGNTRTRLIATLSPTVSSAHESVSTLRFADRAKKVVAFVKVNDRPSIVAGGEEKELVRGLRSEVCASVHRCIQLLNVQIALSK